MSDGKSRKNKVPIFVVWSYFSVYAGCITEYSIKILHVNTFTLKQITILCSLRPTLKPGKTGVDLTIIAKKNRVTFLGKSVHVYAK